MPEPESPSFTRRIVAKVISETTSFGKHKLLTGMCVAITALVERFGLARWRVHQITLSWDELFTSTLIIIGAYITVFLGAFIVNACRAPVLVDKDRQAEVDGVRTERDALELELRPYRTDHGPTFAALMTKGEQIWNAYADAPTVKDHKKQDKLFNDWINETVAALQTANQHTDAVMFSKSVKPSSEDMASFAAYGWKQTRLAEVSEYCKRLEQIISNRRF